MPVVFGNLGRDHWSFNWAQLGNDWDRYLEHLEATLVAHERVVMLTISVDSGVPNATQRNKLAKLLTDRPRVVAHALVTDSAVARGILTALGWVINKSYAEKTFGNVAPALTWLREHDREIDAVAMVADVRKGVPAAVRNLLDPVLG